MEQLNFGLPEIARNLALQVSFVYKKLFTIFFFFFNKNYFFKEDKFSRYVFNLRKMLDSYHLLLASLDESETALLSDHLVELRRCIRPGSKRLNWTSLGIQDYLNRAFAVTFNFQINFSFEYHLFNLSIFYIEYFQVRIDGESN